MTPSAANKKDTDDSVEIFVPTSWLNSLLSARVLLPLGLAAAAGYGGFSARGAVESCPPELTAKLERLENQVEGLDRRFDRVDARLDRLSRRIEDLARLRSEGEPLALSQRRK